MTAMKRKGDAARPAWELTAPMTNAEVLAKLGEIEDEMRALRRLADGTSRLEDADDYRAACAMLLRVVDKRKWVDAEREGALEDIKKLEARIEGWFADVYAVCDEREKFLRSIVQEWALGLDARAKGLRRAAALLPPRDEEKARAMLREADELAPPKIPGIGWSIGATVEIVDEAKIPDHFLKKVPDLKLIKAALEAGGKIPGAKLVDSRSVRVTPSATKGEL